MNATNSNPHTQLQQVTADPVLTLELADLALAMAVQHAAVTSLWNPIVISQPLNALSRSASPLPTKVALMHLPHVDLDTATKLNNVDLLKFMLAWSKKPGGRPANYSHPMLLGMRASALAALDWWLDQSGLCFQRDLRGVLEACTLGRLNVLEWWKGRSFVGYHSRLENGKVPEVTVVISAATRAGRLDVLDWLWKHLPDAQAAFKQACQEESAIMEAVAQSRHDVAVTVAEWWLEKCRTESLGPMPSLAPVLLHALAKRCVALLEWCKSHRQVVEHYQAGRTTQRVYSAGQSALALAVVGNALDWIDSLGIVPTKGEYAIATETACAIGNTDALKWLQDKGWLVGSRFHLLCSVTQQSEHGFAIESRMLQTLQWIHDHAALDLDPEEEQYAVMMGDSVYRDLCTFGHVKVLDWLHSHGYQLDNGDWEHFFGEATNGQHLNVLEWLAAHTKASKKRLTEIATRLEWESHDLSIWKWWLARLGALDAFARIIVAPAFYLPHENPHCTLILQLWLDSGAVLDYAACINSASIAGNVAVLDWFLHVLGVPMEQFVSAFTGSVDVQAKFDRRRSSFSYTANVLLWWRSSIPQVHSLAHTTQLSKKHATGSNPIKAHILTSMLKFPRFPMLDARLLVGEENVAMFMYLCKDPAVCDALRKGPALKFALLWAKQRQQEHVIEWWTSQSGFEMPEGWEW
ncbi:hypothetical protein BCR44DRAFT_35389 [Catenaria anguillulae PL171]|uniref:Ankyrin repeat-containing domain protein n=1 Tax=Catenaria anguillulae PL171 TaxID=765915 RepID=A0A1Y2HP68_9FUNG|nr:hypothetical protein BCR44DRAFT_35389 [Catenaria anguillulae PL171]